MKIRLGFVSNSSSSSFLAYGAYIAEEKVEELGENGLKGLKYWCPGDGERFVGISWKSLVDKISQ